MNGFLKAIAALFALSLVIISIAIIVAFIAPSKIHIAATAQDMVACTSPVEPRDNFVGVALSGGGSRAAIFAAAGLSALEENGILRQVTHVSSVSGGGLPAAYMAANGTLHCDGATANENADRCQPLTYENISAELMRDFSNEMLSKQAVRPTRWFHPSERVTALEEAFSGTITDGLSLSDLPDHPVFMFNTVSYSSGKTFVMSNVALPHPDDAPQTHIDASLRTTSFSEPGCLRQLPDETSLAFAMAASASFPPIYGPVTISRPAGGEEANADYAKDADQTIEYVHLGDGGLTENTGMDTLFEAALDAHALNPAIESLTLISFDAGLKIDEVKSSDTQDLQIWSSRELTRLVDAPNLRGDRYRDLVRQQIIDESPIPIELVNLVFIDADIDWVDDVCPPTVRDDYESTVDYLRNIPTGFSIGACDAAMLKAAAENVVQKELQPGGRLFALAN